MSESPLKQHLELTTPQQRLITAAFGLYVSKRKEQGLRVNLERPRAIGDNLSFEFTAWGLPIAGGVCELAAFMKYMLATHKLYEPGKVRFFVEANGEGWETFPEDADPSVAFNRISAIYEQRRIAIEASPKYVEEQAKAAAEEAANYTTCTHVCHALDLGFNRYDVATWCITFTEVSNKRGALSLEDAQMVLNRLQTMGYELGEGVGTEPEGFEAKIRYIVGQVMHYCQKRCGPHPMLAVWLQKAIKDYLATTQEVAIAPLEGVLVSESEAHRQDLYEKLDASLIKVRERAEQEQKAGTKKVIE